MRWRSFLTLAFALPLVGAGPSVARENTPAKEIVSFGALRAPNADEARGQALAWLKSTGKADPTTLKAFEAIWAEADRPIVDRVAETLALGDSEAAKLLAEARDPSKAAPTVMPPVFKDRW